MKTLLYRFDHWLFEEYRTDVESMALFRILFGAYVLLVALPAGLPSLPAAAYSPPIGLHALFTTPPPHWVMVGLDGVALLCGSSLLVGLFTAASSLGLAVSCALLHSFCFADGTVDQGLVVWIALVLAPSGWGDAFSVDHYRGRRGSGPATPGRSWTLAILAMVIGFALFTAGVTKIRGGWLRTDSDATRFHLFRSALYGRHTSVAALASKYLPSWGWTLGNWFTVAWQTGFMAAVPKKEWCRLACALGACFHLAVWLLFAVRVTDHDIAYGAFVSWALVWPAATQQLRALQSRLAPTPGYALCAVPFALSACKLFVVPRVLTATIATMLSKALLVFGALFALAYLARRVHRLGRAPLVRRLPIGRSPSDG
jgi:hypothetical protein